MRIFKDIAKYAEEVNANFALEGAYAHCMYSPQMLYKLSNEIILFPFFFIFFSPFYVFVITAIITGALYYRSITW